MKNFDIDKIRVTGAEPFDLNSHATDYVGTYESEKKAVTRLKKLTKKISREQEKFYASDNHSLLLVFQAMDAAGKDSTIRQVMSGVNPQGCQIFSFKAPSKNELQHDFLWRTSQRLPERGRIGVFNRSYYEEVLVCRVHPEYVVGQRIPDIKSTTDIDDNFWNQRYESILEHENHLTRNGTRILKFFLNVSKAEQKRRFISRIDTPQKNWKFSHGDIEERRLWDKYMNAYETAIARTATEKNPWYVIPADNKWFMRTCVSEIVHHTLNNMSHDYPTLTSAEQAALAKVRVELLAGD